MSFANVINNSHRRVLTRTLQCLVMLAIASRRSSAFAEEFPSVVTTALSQNAEALSAVSIKWVEQLRSDLPREKFWKLTGLAEGNRTFFEPREYRYVRNGGKWFYQFKEHRQAPPDAPYVDWHDWAFDGALLYEFSHTAASEMPGAEQYTPLLTVRKFSNVAEKDATKNMSFVHCHYFSAAGFYVPQRGGELQASIASLPLHLLDQGAKVLNVSSHGEGDATTLKIELSLDDRTHGFVLDPRNRYAILGYSLRGPRQETIAMIENSEFPSEQIEFSWMPRSSQATWSAWDDWYNLNPRLDRLSETCIVSHEMRVTHLAKLSAAESGDAQYLIDVQSAPPGTLVSDERLPGAEKTQSGRASYIVPPGKDVLGALATEAAGPKPIAERGGYSRFMMINVLIAVMLVLILLGRKLFQRA